MIPQPTISWTLLALLSIAPIANAQYIRIGDPGAIPTAGLAAPTVLRSTVALCTEVLMALKAG